MAIAAVLLLLSAWISLRRGPSRPATENAAEQDQPRLTPPGILEAREQHIDETAWAAEILAQRCGRTVESLWNSLNAASNKLDAATFFDVGGVRLGSWETSRTLPHGIRVHTSTGPGRTVSPAEWPAWVQAFGRRGWQLAQTEFCHVEFDIDDDGQPRQSRYRFLAHLLNPVTTERAALRGDLILDWAKGTAGQELIGIEQVDASRLEIQTRRGAPAFCQVLDEAVAEGEGSSVIDPLIVHDLDDDGFPEIILAAKNLVYRRQRESHYQGEPLLRRWTGMVLGALTADLDGDGSADFVCAKSDGLWLFPGSRAGTFDAPGRWVWEAVPPLKSAVALTCGDIDHDGDLDVFLAQYRVPTLGQFVRPHYYDANDGFPSHLLLNDGHGHFTDETDSSGLTRNRWRRTFATSLVDLNNDTHLDLVVVSDFAGLDLYLNDGRGHFTEVTPDWVADPHAFGMSHALADFNADGRLDLLMIGMDSPTVDRLDHLNLWRPDVTEDRTMRSRMTYGNRLYLAKPERGFQQTALNDSIARSGWSWGCGVADFDNDGFPDVYIATGHQSKQYVHDYEPEYWLHEIYIDESVPDVAASAYFLGRFARSRGSGWSYRGYEKNRLYLNQAADSFVEAAHFMGVGLEEDCRNVVAADLDGDGQPDLVVTTSEVWPEQKATLRVFRNTWPDAGNWLGFRFAAGGPGTSPVGAQVTLRYAGRSAVRQIVTGDSFRSQQPATLHFGLGQVARVERAEIRWPDGQVQELSEPALNRYHRVTKPDRSRP